MKVKLLVEVTKGTPGGPIRGEGARGNAIKNGFLRDDELIGGGIHLQNDVAENGGVGSVSV